MEALMKYSRCVMGNVGSSVIGQKVRTLNKYCMEETHGITTELEVTEVYVLTSTLVAEYRQTDRERNPLHRLD